MHYTGSTLDNLTGDYSCKCLAGIPYERWLPNMGRWPCRRRSILGLEQHTCAAADYGTDPAADIDAQTTAMTLRAISGQNISAQTRSGESPSA